VQNNPVNRIDPHGLWTFTPRLNFTFFTGDVTIGLAFDGQGNIGLQLTGSVGLSLSAGFTGGVTATNAPCIKNLEGPGSSTGGAVNIPGFLPGFEAEFNQVWTGWLNQQNDPDVYKGYDFGIGLGVGLPATPQVFTGSTGTLLHLRY
jgi:hypothetical protein